MRRESKAPIDSLLSLGPKSAKWLAAIGISTEAALRRVGPVPAYVQLKRTRRGISLNLLYSMVGRLEGVHWTEIRRTRRLELLLEVEDHEKRHSPHQ